MPRIRDLKDQQLYRVDKHASYGELDALLTKTAYLGIVEEQWESMVRIAISLKKTHFASTHCCTTAYQ